MCQQYLKCRIHGTNIVSKLPGGCPMAAENPLLALHTLKNAGYSELSKTTRNAKRDGLNIWTSYRTCSRCADKHLTHPRVMALRDRLIGEVDSREQHQRILDVIAKAPKHGS